MIKQEQSSYRKSLPIGLIIAGLFVAALIVYFVTGPVEDEGTHPAGGSDTAAQENISKIDDASDNNPNNSSIAERPAFDLVRISRGGTGVIAGRMAPGSRVELFANGRKISEVTADENGEWVMILEEPLESGSVELNLKAQNSDNAETMEASDIVVVSVPERDDERFIEQQENGVIAVLSPKDGEGASRILQRPGVGAFAEVGDSLSIDSIDYGGTDVVAIAGSALPRVDVRIYLDDTFIQAVRANDEGNWLIEVPDTELSPGAHILRADQTIGEGRVQLRILQPFETGNTLDPAIAEGGVIVKPGNSLWQIARQLYGTGVRYTLIFRENSEQIEDPDKIYPGQIFRLPKG